VAGTDDMSGSRLRAAAKRLLPTPVRRRLRTLRQRAGRPPARQKVRFGSLRRTEPLSRQWGFDRGQPVDRYYIEQFLGANAGSIRGRVLEIADPTYTRRFGRDVTQADVLHVVEGNPHATIVGDLTSADHIPSDAFDCIIITQTIHLIYDFRAALATVHRILKPGGTALATAPGISQISRPDMDRWGDHWRFTTASMARLFGEVFPEELVTVEAHGNVLAATAFLYGLASAELSPAELAVRDPDYQLLITVRAVKGGLAP
jgi:SAM-dependent methyltransferase